MLGEVGVDIAIVGVVVGIVWVKVFVNVEWHVGARFRLVTWVVGSL